MIKQLAQSYDVIKWAQEMDLPVLVALNKIDITSSEQINSVRKELGQAGIGNCYFTLILVFLL